MSAERGQPGGLADPTGAGFGLALRAESLTALALPAARMLLVASVVMAAASVAANLSAVADLTAVGTVELAMHASTVPTLIFATLAGVYSATTDHRFGLFDQRLLSQPRRNVVLLAKTSLGAAVGLLYGILGAITAAVAGSVAFAIGGQSLDLASPEVTRALIGVVVAAPLFSVIGVAVGSAVANQPIAIGGTLAWLLVIEPTVITGMADVGRWLPGAAALSLTYSPNPELLPQLLGGAVLAGYSALSLALAGHRFASADISG